MTGSPDPRSAKFTYSQVYVPPMGGSFMRDNFDVVINQGLAEERLCLSYENGAIPSEAFMRRSQDITPEARENAKLFKGKRYAQVNSFSIDAVAQAIEVNFGAGLLI